MELFQTWNTADALSHLVALAVAYALALPIGWNREQEERSAGVRTFPLVAMAACGFVMIAIEVLGIGSDGQARILEGLITGVGFIGGGASQDLLARLWDLVPTGTRLVMNAVTLETEALVLDWSARHGGTLLKIELSEPAAIGRKRAWRSALPILQWSVTR